MMMMSSLQRVNIAASAQKVHVDNRIPLRIYYRIADNILRQADIFRQENNIIDLYIMLLRYSSLITETIPCHRDYRSVQSTNVTFKKKLLRALTELEQLKPTVTLKVDELNRKHISQVNRQQNLNHNGSYASSAEWPSVQKQTFSNYNIPKAVRPSAKELGSQGSRIQPFSGWPMEEQFRGLSLTTIYPKEETLSRHSILGPNGLHGQWHPPRSDSGVQYPSNIDLTPVEIPSLLNPLDGINANKKDRISSEPEKSRLESILTPTDVSRRCPADEPSLISFDKIDLPLPNITRQPSPPPVLADVQDLIPAMASQVPEAVCELENPSQDSFLRSESPLELHISTAMMENFLNVAKSNTNKDLETCGILAGSLKNRKFYITALIIPKQESTSNSCQATNEEEIFEVQDTRSLFPLGWIHTHPTQSCFMSSIDVHTHYSYQVMLPEAVAIVMAPRDSSRKHGIFRLTTPGGMTAIRHCEKRGFHPHEPLPNGEPLYKQCTDVYMNPNLKFDVIDLR